MNFFRSTIRPVGSLIFLGLFLLGMVGHGAHSHENPSQTEIQGSCEYCQISQNFKQVHVPQSHVEVFSSPFTLILGTSKNPFIVSAEQQLFCIRGPPAHS